MRRAIATVVLLLLLSQQQAHGFPGGPGGCGTPPVAGTHLNADIVISNTLADAGITVTIGDGGPLEVGTVHTAFTGSDLSVVVSAEEGLTYRGILIRLERSDGVDSTGGLSSTDLADAMACNAPVTGVGHSDASDKSSSEATMRIDDVVGATLQVTVVFSNSAGVSSFAFDEYQLSFAEETVVNPVCEICGCSFCTPGEFPLSNPGGSIPIPPEFADQAPPGFTVVPCVLLDLAGSSGQIPADLCNDELRTNPEFREICGCPDLPPRPATDAPEAAPTDMPIPAPTDAPVVAPTDMPVVAPTDMPVVAPTDMPVVAPTDMPVVAPTDMPVVAPTEMPILSPTEAPMVTTITEIPTVAPFIVTAGPTPVVETTTAPTVPVGRCIQRKRR